MISVAGLTRRLAAGVLAIVVAHHGWLLIVVPVAIVLIGRLMGRFDQWRVSRRNASFH